MIALQVDVFDQHQSQILPIVRHIFYAPNKESAEERLLLHCNADAFLHSCYTRGHYNGLECRVVTSYREVMFDEQGGRIG